jgi:isoleucyl-tRNA synthetase
VRDAVPDGRLEPLERYILDRGARLVEEAGSAYERYEFHTVVRRLLDLVTTDLSAFWCDVRKDAFYVLAPADPVRRSAQTAAWRLVQTIATALSPVCPFTAEEIWESIPGSASDPGALFLRSWNDVRLPTLSSADRTAWDGVLALRAGFLARLEPLRREGQVGTASQAHVRIDAGPELAAALGRLGLAAGTLADVFGTPDVTLEPCSESAHRVDVFGGTSLDVSAAPGVKCPRCWQTRRDTGPEGLCRRCRTVVDGAVAPA